MTSPVSMPTGHEILDEDLDAYEALTSAWATYTPAWTSSGTAPAIGNGTLAGRYCRAGLLMHLQIELTWGSTSTAGTGSYFLGAPSGVNFRVSTPEQRVMCTVRDAGTGTIYAGIARVFVSTLGLSVHAGAADGGLAAVTGTAPVTFATGDTINVAGTLEVD